MEKKFIKTFLVNPMMKTHLLLQLLKMKKKENYMRKNYQNSRKKSKNIYLLFIDPQQKMNYLRNLHIHLTMLKHHNHHIKK